MSCFCLGLTAGLLAPQYDMWSQPMLTNNPSGAACIAAQGCAVLQHPASTATASRADAGTLMYTQHSPHTRRFNHGTHLFAPIELPTINPADRQCNQAAAAVLSCTVAAAAVTTAAMQHTYCARLAQHRQAAAACMYTACCCALTACIALPYASIARTQQHRPYAALDTCRADQNDASI